MGWEGRAPGRVNLIGEHIDYAGGLVLPAAVDLFVTVRGEPAADWSVSSETTGGERYLRTLADRLGAGPQRVSISSTLPAGSGMSSSAALLVATAAGLAPQLGGPEAALLCQRAEQDATGVRVGIMDQFASAMGRRGHAILLDCATLEHRYVAFPAGLRMVVIPSGIHHDLSQTPYNQRRREAEEGLAGRPLAQITEAGDNRRLRHLVTELARVKAFVSAMEAGDLRSMGRLLDESHRSLRDDFEVSLPEIDEIVRRATSTSGCLGARIMGGGFGGSVLALVAAGAEARFAEAVARPVILCETASGPFAP